MLQQIITLQPIEPFVGMGRCDETNRLTYMTFAAKAPKI